ncbi:hypothetical protein Tco_1149705 [Tanacetum coccineum]
MPSMVSQGKTNASPNVESDIKAPRVSIGAGKTSVEVGSNSNSDKERSTRYPKLILPLKHKNLYPHIMVAMHPKQNLVIGHQNATTSSLSRLARKSDASASRQWEIAATNVPVSTKRKYFKLGSTSQGKKQKRNLSYANEAHNLYLPLIVVTGPLSWWSMESKLRALRNSNVPWTNEGPLENRELNAIIGAWFLDSSHDHTCVIELQIPD